MNKLFLKLVHENNLFCCSWFWNGTSVSKSNSLLETILGSLDRPVGFLAIFSMLKIMQKKAIEDSKKSSIF